MKGDLFSSDPFVEVRLKHSGHHSHKTNVVRHTLNPYWNQDFILQSHNPDNDELIVRLMDHDTFSRNDYLGEVVIPLSKYLWNKGIPQDEWFPIMFKKSHLLGLTSSTHQGKGEIHLVVSVGEPRPMGYMQQPMQPPMQPPTVSSPRPAFNAPQQNYPPPPQQQFYGYPSQPPTNYGTNYPPSPMQNNAPPPQQQQNYPPQQNYGQTGYNYYGQ